jgi:hypothetical protein
MNILPVIYPCPFAVGVEFDDLALLKSTACAWAMRKVFEFDTPRSSPTRYEIICHAEACSWRLYATSISGSKAFRVNAFNGDHTCIGLTHSGHKNATVKFICDWILPTIRQQPHYRPSHLVKEMKTEFAVEITYTKALRAKELALEVIHGKHEDSYKAISKYCFNIEQSNPGSIVQLDITAENRFQRVFICYNASATGFSHCLPLLGIDGTHLKTRYQGILLAATGVDAKGQLFPLAYAIVDAENDDNWLWMLQLIHRVIEVHAPHFLENKVIRIISISYIRNLHSFPIVRKVLSKVSLPYFLIIPMAIACVIFKIIFIKNFRIKT